MSKRDRRLRATVLSIALALGFGLAAAAPAAAVDVPATCADLQAKLDAAQDGDVVILSGICTGQYTLPSFPTPGPAESYKQVTLRGEPSDGEDGFDRDGVAGRALTGSDVHRFTLQDLLFRDGVQSGNGGAVSITGDSAPRIVLSRFFNNTATEKGGAVYVRNESPGFLSSLGFLGNTFGSETDPGEGNTASVGGAVSVEIATGGGNSGLNQNLFANNIAATTGGAYDFALLPGVAENVSVDGNTVLSNRAGGAGGGGHIVIGNATFLNITNERYEGNSVEPIAGVTPVAEDHLGGGLFVENGGSGMNQHDNVFRGNAVNTVPSGQSYGGGGEAIVGDNVRARSDFDTFDANTVAGQPAPAEFESEGGGVFLSGASSTFHGWLAVVTRNQVGAGGEGGGVYVGAANTRLELSDSTVVSNSVGAGGSNPGLGGGGGDHLQLHNSIVFNSPMPDIGGFSTFSVQYSDACQPDGTPFPGPGNIGADPLLRDPAAGDIHQTPASPTIDKGNNELFFAEEEFPTEDFERDPRPTDGDGDDASTVDMGADETPVGFAVAPPTPGAGCVPSPPAETPTPPAETPGAAEPPPPAVTPPPTAAYTEQACGFTIDGVDLLGGDTNDILVGTVLSDRLRGGAGKDRINGAEASDCLYGQADGDRVRGGDGDDVIRAGSGNDKISGGDGDDNVKAQNGDDKVKGGPGDDRIKAQGRGRDRVNCGSGRDLVIGGPRDKISRNCERVKILSRR